MIVYVSRLYTLYSVCTHCVYTQTSTICGIAYIYIFTHEKSVNAGQSKLLLIEILVQLASLVTGHAFPNL